MGVGKTTASFKCSTSGWGVGDVLTRWGTHYYTALKPLTIFDTMWQYHVVRYLCLFGTCCHHHLLLLKKVVVQVEGRSVGRRP
uniref:Uncharacterized protein n=1 Tax=Hyaloperonospora arabidopsidis (strain Emoy2) TaxID=559515 RepID=M4BE47_HYAAE